MKHPQTGVQQSKIQILAFSAINAKPSASRQASLTSTKCRDVWTQNLDVDEIGPLPPQLLHPPGLHLPGCSPPLQLPGPGHCQAGHLLPGHKQASQPIYRPNAKWTKPIDRLPFPFSILHLIVLSPLWNHFQCSKTQFWEKNIHGRQKRTE